MPPPVDDSNVSARVAADADVASIIFALAPESDLPAWACEMIADGEAFQATDLSAASDILGAVVILAGNWSSDGDNQEKGLEALRGMRRKGAAIALIGAGTPPDGVDDILAPSLTLDEARSRIALLQSIAELRVDNARLVAAFEQASTVDPLTGLPNRAALFDLMKHEWRRSLRSGRPLAVVMVDLDHFKQINDRYGHLAGDEVLRKAAEILRDESRAGDVIARYAGDEFAILLPETDAVGASVWAERRRASLAEAMVDYRGQTIRFTASFGVSVRSGEHAACEDLLDAADKALLLAKLRRNCVRSTDAGTAVSAP